MTMADSEIWVLLGAKAGDNAQALRLATALNRSFISKNLVLKAGFETAKPDVEASLHHIDLERSDPLSAPWPHLVLTVGRRLSMVALWIKKQSQAHTRIALIGCPKSRISDFDLVIAALHYRLPKAPNVCRIGLPLLAVSHEKLAEAAKIWAPRLAQRPRPLTVVLFGGTTGKRPFSPRTASNILKQLGNYGTVYIVTSRRTPVNVIEAIDQGLPSNALLYRWRRDDPDNPYLGLLALGERFVVTGDSLSMLVEVARLGRPLAIAALPRAGALSRLFPGKSRDISSLHAYLRQGRWAVKLGQPFIAPPQPPPDDIANAAARLLSLLETQD